MALRRPPAPETRTIVHREASTFVSHHHAGPPIPLGVTMQIVLPPERSPAVTPRPVLAPPTPRPLLRTVAILPPTEQGGPGPLQSLALDPRRPSPILLRPATGSFEDPGAPPVSRTVTTVVTTVRREERVRLETVVRRLTSEVASLPARGAAPLEQRGVWSEPAEPTRAPRRSSVAPPAQPPTISDVEVARLTDHVVQRIQRRVITQRERMGGR
jgi:hypothetical protein